MLFSPGAAGSPALPARPLRSGGDAGGGGGGTPDTPPIVFGAQAGSRPIAAWARGAAANNVLSGSDVDVDDAMSADVSGAGSGQGMMFSPMSNAMSDSR